jgi:DNA-binding IclR family transcriptional regulator
MSSADQPLDRAFAVMGAVAAGGRALSITEIAQQCRLPVPTVHRIVAQLEQRALLKRALGSRKVLVGANLIRLGAAAVDASMRFDDVHQALAALANEIGEHCQLGVRDGNQVVYSDTVRAAHSTGLHFEQGKRAPLYCSSIGKLWLAEMSNEEFEEWLKRVPREPLTRQTIVSERGLRAAVKAARSRAWSASNGEMAAGVVGCAVPVRLSNHALVAGLGVSVPSARMPFSELETLRVPMERAAQAIARAVEES